MATHVDDKGRRDNTLAPPTTSQMVTRFVRANALPIGIMGVLIALWLFFVIMAPNTFLSSDIYAAFMATVPFFGIVALPLTMVIIAGDIDLSFPSIMAVGVVAFVEVFDRTGSAGLAFAACLASGFLTGLLNGFLVVKIGIR